VSPTGTTESFVYGVPQRQTVVKSKKTLAAGRVMQFLCAQHGLHLKKHEIITIKQIIVTRYILYSSISNPFNEIIANNGQLHFNFGHCPV
jgi:hypothetical protein